MSAHGLTTLHRRPMQVEQHNKIAKPRGTVPLNLNVKINSDNSTSDYVL